MGYMGIFFILYPKPYSIYLGGTVRFSGFVTRGCRAGIGMMRSMPTELGVDRSKRTGQEIGQKEYQQSPTTHTFGGS